MPHMFGHTVTRALSCLGLAQRGMDPHPRQPAPMLLQKADVMVASPDWTYEPKWDGFRVLASIRGGSVRLVSRNGRSFTNLFGPISDALRGFPVSILLDGEVVAINDRGQQDLETLQARLQSRNGKLPGHLCYMVFDCLYVNGHSLLNRSLEDRRAILGELQHALQTDSVKLTEGFPAEKSERLMKACVSMGLEGVVMKRRTSVYRPGFRSPDWIKVPVLNREEFVVAGYFSSSPNHLSSLIVGHYDRAGRLTFSGLVGAGLSNETRLAILRELQAARRKTCPFSSVPELRDHFGGLRADLPPHWVRPTLVVEVEYRQRLKDGLRHVALKGVRPDRRPRQVVVSSQREQRPS